MAWANVATNSPMANWLGSSCRNVCTMRGENWPIASWTTTMVMVRTKAASDTIDAAIVSRIASPRRGRRSATAARLEVEGGSIAMVTIDSTTPASTHITGTNHRLERTRVRTAMDNRYPGTRATSPGHEPQRHRAGVDPALTRRRQGRPWVARYPPGVYSDGHRGRDTMHMHDTRLAARTADRRPAVRRHDAIAQHPTEHGTGAHHGAHGATTSTPATTRRCSAAGSG